ncbi:MAG: RNA polymerase sigma factor [Acidobacteriota bacterium]
MSDQELLQRGYRYALSLCGEAAEAEDLVQQAWLRIYQRYGKGRRLAALFPTLRRLFIDRYRRDRVVEFVPLEEVAEEPETLAVPVLARVDLERHLAALRMAEREALFLQVVEGWTAAEIAALTEQSRGTVLSLLFRARRKLAAALEAPARGEAR